MNGHLLPSDADWPEDKRLMADLSHLNTQITRYIFNLLDADAGRAKPMSADDEHQLGLKLAELGERVQHRAAQRETPNNGRVIEGEATLPQALEPGQPNRDNGP